MMITLFWGRNCAIYAFVSWMTSVEGLKGQAQTEPGPLFRYKVTRFNNRKSTLIDGIRAFDTT